MFRYQPVFSDYHDKTPAVFRESWAGPYGKFLAVPENFYNVCWKSFPNVSFIMNLFSEEAQSY